jgi:hypothetical protein
MLSSLKTLIPCATAFLVTLSAVAQTERESALLNALRRLPRKPSKEEISAVISAHPDWETIAWNRLVRLTIDSRATAWEAFLGDLQQNRTSPRGRPEFEAAWISAARERMRAWEARNALANFIDSLLKLNGKRLVRLLGPLLEENQQMIADLDNLSSGAQEIAEGRLLSMRSRECELRGLPEVPTDADWKKWWSAHKAEYGPVLSIPKK